jgi:hypothetical protein
MELYEKKGRGATRKKGMVVTECAETGYRTRQVQYSRGVPEAFGIGQSNPVYRRVTV